MNLKTTQNIDVQKMSVDVWNFWKKYMNYNNASPDQKEHFTESIWDAIISDMGEISKRWNENRFVINLLMAYLEELEARDRGAYLAPDERT